MSNEEIIKKARELGLSENEIQQFIKNQEIAQKYGFDGEYSSIDVKIDKNININAELNKDEECDCDCDCDDECCCQHNHSEEECECDCHCNHHHKLNS